MNKARHERMTERFRSNMMILKDARNLSSSMVLQPFLSRLRSLR